MNKSVTVAALTLMAFAGTAWLGPSAAYADKGNKVNKVAKLEAKFVHLDTNNDGKLSKEEFANFTVGKNNKKLNTAKLFARLDTNNDGFLSKDEFMKLATIGGKNKGKGAKSKGAALAKNLK